MDRFRRSTEVDVASELYQIASNQDHAKARHTAPFMEKANATHFS